MIRIGRLLRATAESGGPGGWRAELGLGGSGTGGDCHGPAGSRRSQDWGRLLRAGWWTAVPELAEIATGRVAAGGPGTGRDCHGPAGSRRSQDRTEGSNDILLFGWRLDALRAHRLGFEGAQEYQHRVFLPGGKSAFVCRVFEQ
jgi:hypothetical protein